MFCQWVVGYNSLTYLTIAWFSSFASVITHQCFKFYIVRLLELIHIPTDQNGFVEGFLSRSALFDLHLFLGSN